MVASGMEVPHCPSEAVMAGEQGDPGTSDHWEVFPWPYGTSPTASSPAPQHTSCCPAPQHTAQGKAPLLGSRLGWEYFTPHFLTFF